MKQKRKHERKRDILFGGDVEERSIFLRAAKACDIGMGSEGAILGVAARVTGKAGVATEVTDRTGGVA